MLQFGLAGCAAVRFGFVGNRAHCNLCNKEGLPAVGFRTDTEWTPEGK